MVGLKGIDDVTINKIPELKKFIRRAIGDFEIDFSPFHIDDSQRVFPCVLWPKHDLTIMFGLDRPILCIAFFDDYSLLPLTQTISGSLSTLEKNSVSLDPRYIFLCSTSENCEKAVDTLSLLSDQPSLLVAISTEQAKLDNAGIKKDLFQQIGIKNYFDNADPIRSDAMFFGRQRILTNILGSLRDGQNIGLFGLRRVGKTSILYAIDRIISQRGMGTNLLISLDEPSTNQLRWFDLLQMIADRLSGPSIRNHFSAEDASRLFKKCVTNWIAGQKGKQLILSFDEIEHIVPGTCKRAHWQEDYFFLWDTLRAISREIKDFSIIICGINSRALEASHLSGLPNPIFNGMRTVYVPMFNADETLQMVSKLGLYMGISFEMDSVLSIHKEYGGHPLLIRQACSHIFQHLERDHTPWPFSLNEAKASSILENQRPFLFHWCSYILLTLKEFYPEEFEMLGVLSAGETEYYVELETKYPEWARHLRGYGLVIGSAELAMPFLRDFMVSKEKSGIDDVILARDKIAKNETKKPRAEYDVAFIVALDEELDALLSRLDDPRSVRDDGADIPYELHEAIVSTKSETRKLRVLACSAGRIGPSEIQSLVLHVALRFRVEKFLLVGICAGVKGEVKVGDVVIADQVIDYSQVKRTNNGDEERARVFPVGVHMYNAAKKFRRFAWPELTGKLKETNDDRRVIYGNIASGPVVFANSKAMRDMRRKWPKMVAAEMEAAGALHALHSIGKGDSFLVVKCVSDLGDQKKTDHGRAIYCETAASFAIDLIRSKAWSPQHEGR